MMSQTRTSSDADDVHAAKGGDREAFGRLYDRHAPGVRAVVAAVSRDFDAVDDLTQETFLRGYRGLTTLRDPKDFHRWIRGIARWVARERRRALGRSRQVAMLEKPLVDRGDSHDAVERDELRRHLVSAIAELPERERLAVHAFYFHGRRADEAAVSMGLSRSGFYAALERGMARIRKRLGVPATTHPNARREQ